MLGAAELEGSHKGFEGATGTLAWVLKFCGSSGTPLHVLGLLFRCTALLVLGTSPGCIVLLVLTCCCSECLILFAEILSSSESVTELLLSTGSYSESDSESSLLLSSVMFRI